MTFHSRRRKPMADINVVPFIDVMLVLLVIFMITAPLMTQGVKVNLPETQAKAIAQDQRDPLIVTVDAAGNYYCNLSENPHQPLTDQALSHLVQTEIENTKEQPRQILVRGDTNANYGKVIAVMALLQNLQVIAVFPSGFRRLKVDRVMRRQ